MARSEASLPISFFCILFLYYCLIHPHLLCGLPLLEKANQSYLNRLQRLQNKAIRIITDFKLRMSITSQYHKLGILKLPELNALEIAELMHQYSHNTIPQPMAYLINTAVQSALSIKNYKGRFSLVSWCGCL